MCMDRLAAKAASEYDRPAGRKGRDDCVFAREEISLILPSRDTGHGHVECGEVDPGSGSGHRGDKGRRLQLPCPGLERHNQTRLEDILLPTMGGRISNFWRTLLCAP